ncbi:MAG TPA: hypothetical protein VHC91_16505 [Trinickia sp.]|uniref:hypothetical protein n=1 Tax=Trinickia sp. TaxID=2571163 RepID=UPI002BDF9C53|nr:hypothetical protein [Trinickia sp.]HVW51965.1 hypothetical protein [Trinickia sp.]
MENGLSLRPGFKSGSGQSINDYATATAGQWAAVLRGMSRAINDVRTKTAAPLRSVADTVYVDFGLVPFLESQGVTIDKVAYHYYSLATTPYKIYPPSGVPVDLFAELGKLGKPIIINELNAGEIYAPAQGKPYNDAQALLSLKTHIGYILGQTEANIEGAEFYELYDEPSKDAVESNFGLMTDPTHPKTQMLLAAVYACGQLTASEQAALVASNLFTASELSARRASCPASH